MRSILPAVASQMFPSGPAQRPCGSFDTPKLVATPWTVMRPTRALFGMLNHRAPSGPEVIKLGPKNPEGSANSTIEPPVVARPMRFAVPSVNQMFPSGPAVMPIGFEAGVAVLNSVIAPVGVMRPILLALNSANQML